MKICIEFWPEKIMVNHMKKDNIIERGQKLLHLNLVNKKMNTILWMSEKTLNVF
jgi:hypothetical protein